MSQSAYDDVEPGPERKLIAAQLEIQALRRELWSRHGHTGPALYGDDGKLQCKECMLDFATDPIQKIVDRFVLLDINSLLQERQKEKQ